MLVGTRDARGPVSGDWFARQWRQPHVRERMSGLGFDEPEQLGALFIGDADYLRRIVGDEAALVDDYPKRIVADFKEETGELFGSMNDVGAARGRFEASPFIARLWPDSVKRATLPYFERQRIVSELIQLAGHPLSKSIADLHAVMTTTSLTAPIQWHMGSNVDAQHAFDRLGLEERERPVWQYQLAARMMSQRRFSEALVPLRKAEELPDLFMSGRIFRIYALCLDGRVADARALARETYPLLEQETRLQGWWDFFRETYGIEVGVG